MTTKEGTTDFTEDTDVVRRMLEFQIGSAGIVYPCPSASSVVRIVFGCGLRPRQVHPLYPRWRLPNSVSCAAFLDEPAADSGNEKDSTADDADAQPGFAALSRN